MVLRGAQALIDFCEREAMLIEIAAEASRTAERSEEAHRRAQCDQVDSPSDQALVARAARAERGARASAAERDRTAAEAAALGRDIAAAAGDLWDLAEQAEQALLIAGLS